MHVGIDACCWSNRRGFGRYTRELVSCMVDEHPAHRFSLVVDAQTAAEGGFPASAELVSVPTSEQPTQAASARSARRPRDLWRLSRAASRLAPDVFFFPAVYSFYPLPRRIPAVITFHDATAEGHPRLVFASWWARLFWRLKSQLALRQASRLLTVSEAARGQVAAAFGLDADAIRVVPEAPAGLFRPLAAADPRRDAVRHRYGLPAADPIVLYVGGISPHKNLERLLEAFARVAAGRRCHLALVGDDESDSFLGSHEETARCRERLGLSDRVTFTGFVPNEDLVSLYAAAALLVLPSLNEGFGLPAVEAMACGLPVAASRAGSLPEVLGDAGVLFDPLEPAEIARAVAALLDDAGLRATLRQRGLERARLYSWSAAARRTLAVLAEVAR